jgi:hypothetical protein
MTEVVTAITLEDVRAAAETLLGAGKKVSSLSVREQLGRGSFTTVKKFLDQLKASPAPAGQPGAAVPPQLESLWMEARREAETAFVADRKNLELMAAGLETKMLHLEAVAAEAHARLQEVERRLADRNEELKRALEEGSRWRTQAENTGAKLLELLQQALKEGGATQDWLRKADHRMAALDADMKSLGNAVGAGVDRLTTDHKQAGAVLEGLLGRQHEEVHSAVRALDQQLDPMADISAAAQETLRQVRGLRQQIARPSRTGARLQRR